MIARLAVTRGVKGEEGQGYSRLTFYKKTSETTNCAESRFLKKELVFSASHLGEMLEDTDGRPLFRFPRLPQLRLGVLVPSRGTRSLYQPQLRR